MGTTVELRRLPDPGTIYRLLIYCKAPPEISAAAVSVNKTLAGELLQLPPERRTMQLDRCFTKLLNSLPANPVLKDIDVMFHPDYRVDVMRILLSAYKNKPYSLIWPGGYSDGRLTYSEEGLPDYRVFAISDYDVMCVV